MDPNYLHIYFLWIPVLVYKGLCNDLFMLEDWRDLVVNTVAVLTLSALLTGFTWLVLSWCLNIN